MRRIAIGILGALGVLLLLLLLLVLFPPTGFLRDRLVGELETRLQRPVEVGDVDLRLLSGPSVSLRDLHLGAGPEDPSTIDVESVDLQVRLGPLLRRELEIVRIHLEAPRVLLPATGSGSEEDLAAKSSRANSSGSNSNPAIANEPSGRVEGSDPRGRNVGSGSGTSDRTDGSERSDLASAGKQAPVSIRVERLTISAGRVALMDADGRETTTLAGISETLKATVNREGDIELTGSTTIDSLSVQTPGGTLGQGMVVRLEKDLLFRTERDRLEIRRADLDLGGLAVSVTGVADQISSNPSVEFAIQGGPASVPGILGFLPAEMFPEMAGMESEGIVSLAATFHGPLGSGQETEFDLNLDLSDGKVIHPNLPEPVEGIELTLRATPREVAIDRLRARSAHSHIDLSATITEYQEDPKLDASLEGDVDLAIVSKLQLGAVGGNGVANEVPKLSGVSKFDLELTGRASKPKEIQSSGTVTVIGVSVEDSRLEHPVRNANGSIRVRGVNIEIPAFRFEMGASDFDVRGKFSNVTALLPENPTAGKVSMDLQVASNRLDLDELSPKPEGADVGATQGSKPASGSSESLESPAPPAFLAILPKLDGPFLLQAKRMRFREIEAENVQASATIRNSRIDLSEASMKAYDGTMRFAGKVDFRDPQAPTVDFGLTAKKLAAAQVVRESSPVDRVTRLSGYVAGTVDATAQFAGTLDQANELDLQTLIADGNVEVREGKLSGHPIQKALATYLDQPALEVIPFTDWLQRFEIRDGRVHFEEVTIEGSGLTFSAVGWQSLQGELGITTQLLLPQKMSEGVKQKVPKELRPILFDPGQSRVEVPLKIGGKVTAPSISLDSPRLQARAQALLEKRLAEERKKAEGEAKTQLEKAADDLLKDLLGSSKPDSAAADSAATTKTLENEVKSVLKGLFK